MTQGAQDDGLEKNVQDEPNKKGDGEQSDVNLENLKKDLAGKDSKINELVKANKDLASKFEQVSKEKEAKELAGKSAEEQLIEYQKKIKVLEQKEAFRQSFKDVGLNPDDFQEIVNETNPTLQAQKFAELLKAQTAASAEKALEEFKKKELEKIPKEPKPKELKDSPNAVINNNIRAALGK